MSDLVPADGNLPVAADEHPPSRADGGYVPAEDDGPDVITYLLTLAKLKILQARFRSARGQLLRLQRRKEERAEQASQAADMLSQAGVTGEGIARVRETAAAATAQSDQVTRIVGLFQEAEETAAAMHQAHQTTYGPIHEAVNDMGVEQALADFYRTD
ncbi:hypothetical protein [Streptomyces sp. NPDC048636]|uniref:hypothetical protein n=1 Tax=Streptomyces sp. NPDC048636 TaxID=3155762 RepID=UPI00341CA4A1